MTDIFAPTSTPEAPVGASTRRIPVGLFRFAGVALAAFPVLLSAGMVFSPPQTLPGEAGYIASLAADPTVSLISANLLHYAWVALALGVMGVIGLVAARRGRAWVAITAVIVAFGAVQLSGLLLSDWFLISAGNNLSIEQALAMDAGAKEASAGVWLITAQVFSMLGVPALSFGLARARVVSWWIAPLPLLAFIVPMFNLGVIAALAVAPLMAPIFVAAYKLIRLPRTETIAIS
ncbi:hypothetical protein M2152_002113 [Microbacteriaceae bacterium SG_E_30_P1]|uniref:DUF4386 family protein n=1 Tax=Antiquaquibacter oligotrophicus TaxID=2880260 RepID=A0ABT6KQ35_9MICO|nr:hypothetical protein [Antiquaquibacter oligotrophicus]MDH6181931.1 hypothetical protein [Antiquaquibacter oligotrophicus]UDF12398.1 hypothetical protein LH407_09525 [Antiquaquibacter oligotrophicus]